MGPNHGRKNTYVFKHTRKNIILTPTELSSKESRPKNKSPPQIPVRKGIYILNHKFRCKIAMSNVDYKLLVDVHRRAKEFNMGDNVIVHIRPKFLHKYSFKKFMPKPLDHYPTLENLDLMRIYLIYLIP